MAARDTLSLDGHAGMEGPVQESYDDVFAEHAEWLFNVYRLVVADRSAAAAMTAGTLADACAAGEPDRMRLLALALERMAPSLRVPRPEAARWAALDDPPPAPAVRGEVDDVTLALYVRSLPFPIRQVVALRAILGVDAERVANLLGLPASVLERLERHGLALLSERLAAHVEERQRRAPAPVPVSARAHLMDEQAAARPSPGLVRRIVLTLERLAAFAREGVTVHGIDRAGTVRRPATPPPTPTARPIERPPATPSMREYPAPGATGGTGVHRRSPAGTPSTQRLSNPRRPGRP